MLPAEAGAAAAAGYSVEGEGEKKINLLIITVIFYDIMLIKNILKSNCNYSEDEPLVLITFEVRSD